MDGGAEDHKVSEGKEFYFMRSIRFSIPTKHKASTLPEFLECLDKVSTASLYLHMFEARLRHPLGTNDFSDWFERELGEKKLALEVAELDPYTQTMEGLRRRIITFVQKAIEEVAHVAP
jgi:hypothetical protein